MSKILAEVIPGRSERLRIASSGLEVKVIHFEGAVGLEVLRNGRAVAPTQYSPQNATASS